MKKARKGDGFCLVPPSCADLADPGERSQSETNDPGERSQSETNDPGERSQSETNDPGERSQSETNDPDARRLIAVSRTARAEERCVASRHELLVRRRRPEDYSGFIIIRLSDLFDVRRELAVCDLFEKRLPPAAEPPAEGPPRHPPAGEPPAHREVPAAEPPPGEGPPAAGPPHPQLGKKERDCWLRLLKQCPLRRLVQSITPEQILELEAAALASDFPPRHTLAAYWRLDARHLPGRLVKKMVRLLNDLPTVDLAYRELAAKDPQEPFADLQGYRDPAPAGIGANGLAAAGRGAGANVVDLEQGWILDHEDLLAAPAGGAAAPKVAPPIYGTNRHRVGAYRGDHGTAVLGELIADDANRKGVAGIAPAAGAAVVSHYHGAGATSGQFPDTNGHVADAVVAVVARLRPPRGPLPKIGSATVAPGDVLLIEVQRSFKPTEVDHADFDALRLASALGLVVVEAAGNGHVDLDLYEDETGRLILRRGHPDFRDSGAILVGAARSELPHERAVFSNFGSRLDCWAWGDDVVTAGYGDLAGTANGTDAYTATFGGTSAAAPIVAGAALVVQGLYADSPPLPPAEVRRRLADAATGTRQGPRVPGCIGVMPDLAAVVRRLGLYADVYLRADRGDDGFASSGVTSSTPDLVVEGAGAPGATIQARLRNRGSADASGVRVTFYRSELATLTLPGMWRRLGRRRPDPPAGPRGRVPRGNLAVPTVPLPLGAEQQPPACYLALVDFGQQPPPELPPARPPYFRWQDFLRFNRRHPRRNVARLAAGALPVFTVAGAPDRERTFDFEILQSLPAGATLELTAPPALAGRLRRGPLRQADLKPAANGTDLKLTLPRRPRLVLSRVRLGRDAVHRCTLTVSLAAGATLAVGHRVAVRQLFAGEEVGRVTWE
ncbi:MAG: hypothetical protein D6696_20665 [Acidobacteria bacterium]|nr:MAG: hypothetical protein D6696_20665 [Acidobacteriota bacterium]